MEPKAASGHPWRGEISPKNSTGGPPEVTNEFFGGPEGLLERFWGLLRRAPNLTIVQPLKKCQIEAPGCKIEIFLNFAPRGSILHFFLSGGPGAAKADFGPIWGAIWGSFLGLKILQNRFLNQLEIEHCFGTPSLASGSRRGSSLGPFWGPLGGHFGVDFPSPGAISDFSKKRARASAGARFSGFGGPKKEPKIDPKTPPKTACRSMRAPRASRRPLGRLLGSILGPFCPPETAPEPLQNRP